MTMNQISCFAALLFFASGVAENTGMEQELKDLRPEQDSLKWLNKSQEKQEWIKKNKLIDLAYKLSKTENGIILREHADPETQAKNRRGLAGTAAPIRRAGCRVVFWKSRTAC